MKKLSALWITAVFIFLTACSGGPEAKNNNKNGGDADSGVKTVVVAVAMSSRFLEQAVEKFEQQNKNIKIEIKEYMALPKPAGGERAAMAISQADIEKYVQSITTEALSGKGSDIISTSSLPVDQFVKKQVFMDLNQWMKQDESFDRNLYFSGVFDSMQQDGGLYSMPLEFMLTGTFSANEDLLKKAGISIDDSTWTWSQFKDISKQIQQKLGKEYSTGLYYAPSQLFWELFSDNYSELVKEGKPQFDSKLFKDILKQVKELSDEGTLIDMSKQSNKAVSMNPGADMDPAKQVFMPYSMIGSPTGAFMALKQPTLSKYLNKPTVDGHSSGVIAQISDGYALNSKSVVQPEAWKFLKFLLSEEMQLSSEMMGYPVHKKAATLRLEKERATFEKENEGAASAEKMDAHVKMIQGMLDKAVVTSSGDIRLTMLIMKDFDSYMDGQKSLDEVSKLIQNRAITYLNE
jgi:multiple sugar transport system substrate-binding protein